MDKAQINALVHEHVMSGCLHRNVERATRPMYSTICGFDNGKYCERTKTYDEGYPRCMDCGADVSATVRPDYVGDMNDAMQVVEKVKADKNVFSLHCYEEGKGAGWKWRATFAYPNSNTATADAPALAICLAALKTHGVTLEQTGEVS